MLYIFAHRRWFKMGITRYCPWRRLMYNGGFWVAKHPLELCLQLGSEQFELRALFEGGFEEEAALKSLFPPACGEFWPQEDLERILSMARLMLRELPMPPYRPDMEGIRRELLPCCKDRLGMETRAFTCRDCGKQFARHVHMQNHRNDVHKKLKVACKTCSKMVLPRNLKRHEGACKGR